MANLADTSDAENLKKWLADGFSSESTQRELSNEYQHDRVQVFFFKNLCILLLWTKVASALEGLTFPMLRLLFPKAQGDNFFLKTI